MPPMPPNLVLKPRDNDSDKNKDNSSEPPLRGSSTNVALVAGLVTTFIFIIFLLVVVVIPLWRRRIAAKKEAAKAKPKSVSSVSQFMDKNSRFDRSFHGHRRTPSDLRILDPDQAYLPSNRRPPAQDLPHQADRAPREIPAVHFNDQPEHIGETRQANQDRPVSHQYYIPPPQEYVENHFPPTPGTGRTRDNGDPFADPAAGSGQYHDIGLESPSPHLPDQHWDQYHPQSANQYNPQSARSYNPQSARSGRRTGGPGTGNALTPKSAAQGADTDEGSASPLTAYINHLNNMADPPATAPAYSTFTAPRSAGLPFQHQQQPNYAAHRQTSYVPRGAPSQLLPSFPEETGLSSGSDYSESPASHASGGAHLVPGYGPGTRGTGYDHTVPHSMPTHGHISFAHEQQLARAKAGKDSVNGAGTALRTRFGGVSPQPSPRLAGALHSAGLGPRSAGLAPGIHSAGIPPHSPALLSASHNKSHFSPMTPDFRQSRMPLPYDALPEVPNSSIAYGFALPPSPLSPGDEIVVSPSPYHANFSMNR